MSKKSRKRNKKILAALALAGGAAMMAKGRKKASIADMDDAGIGVTHSALKTPYITKKDKTAIIPKKKPVDDSWLDTPRGPHGAGGKGDMWRRIKDQKYETGEHYTPNLSPYTPRVHSRMVKSADGGRIGAKKGGRVTGIAKRGFGRALMKGKK